MPRFHLTPAADQDIDDIGLYIGVEQHRPWIAEKILGEIEERCRLYATQPFMGTARPDLGKDYRVFHYKRWVIIYRPISDGIEVIRVVDGSRDYESLF